MKVAVLGSPIDDVVGLIGGLPPIISQVLEDPALPEVLDLVAQIVAEESARAPSASSGPGVGLSSAVFPLKAFLAVREHPWIPWAAGGLALAVPFFLGVLVGRARGR